MHLFEAQSPTPPIPLFTLRRAPRGTQRKTRGRVDRYSFLVRIFHSLLHAGLARRTVIGILQLTPADYPEGLHYVRADHLPKIVSQGRFWIGIVLIAVGVSVLRSTIPAGVAVVVSISGVTAGLYLSITAMRLNDRR